MHGTDEDKQRRHPPGGEHVAAIAVILPMPTMLLPRRGVAQQWPQPCRSTVLGTVHSPCLSKSRNGADSRRRGW